MKYFSQRTWIILAAVLVSASVLWLVMTRGPLAATQVELATVRQGDLHPAVFGIGTVEARFPYALGPTQAGRVKSVAVDQGDRVRAGQVLAELDPVDMDERIQSAAEGMQRARFAVTGAEAQLRQATSQQKLAQASATRYQDLEAKHFVSRESADAKASEAEVARLASEAARATLAAAGRDVARFGKDREGLLKQRANLRLISPVTGVVVSREAEPGTTVVAGQVVLRVVDPALLWVRTRIDQNQAGAIASGQPARIVLRSHQESSLVGRVVRVETQGDSVSQETLVDVAFNATPARLVLGELAEVTVVLPVASHVLFVPTAAIKEFKQQHGVWRVVDGKTRFQPVATGIDTLEGQTEIVKGLAPGDEVVVYSPTDLLEGMKVKVARVRD